MTWRDAVTAEERETLADVMLALLEDASWVDGQVAVWDGTRARVIIDGATDHVPAAAGDLVNRLRAAAQDAAFPR